MTPSCKGAPGGCWTCYFYYMNKNTLFSSVSVVAAAIIAVVVFVLPKDVPETAAISTREMATICDPEMGNLFHIHPELEIRIDGEAFPIEGNIGVTQTCMTRLHTHEPGGVIHVESPEVRPFTLGDFFAVWGKTFTRDQLFEHVATDGKKIRLTVNGSEVDTYENTLLIDKAKIVISYE